MTGSANGRPSSLQSGAVAALSEADLAAKVERTLVLNQAWLTRTLSLRPPTRIALPDRPGRPARPVLVPANKVEKRGSGSAKGRIALIHSLCHIELNAIDLALDIVARFASVPVPRSFFDGWMMVAAEEAKHFTLLRARLNALGADYGDLPAHDGLWEAAQETDHDLTARLALVPLVLEARGLDVTPGLARSLENAGDSETAAILKIIYEDEKGHVAVGAKWFRFLCRREGREPAASFQELVRRHFRAPLKPPFNDRARAASGLTPGFYRAISSLGN
jgi:uncharacterized ferritin-like protein (DUF455 family)